MTFLAGFAVGLIVGAVGIVAFSFWWANRQEQKEKKKSEDLKMLFKEGAEILKKCADDLEKTDEPFEEFDNKN